MSNENRAGNQTRSYVPTYVRVWVYQWMVAGIPRGPSFWRPIPGRYLVTFVVGAVVLGLTGRHLHWHTGVFWGLCLYLGVPGLVAAYVGYARLGGKRFDRWVLHRAQYRLGPKVYNRFRPIQPQEPVIMDGMVRMSPAESSDEE